MIAGAIELIRSRGVNATSTREVVRHTDTPRGSIRHHFPNGKKELIRHALNSAGDQVTEQLATLIEKEGAAKGLQKFALSWAKHLDSTDYLGGCPVLAVSVEQYLGEDGQPDRVTQQQLLDDSETIFSNWESVITEGILDSGITHNDPKTLAITIVCLFEGAVARSRAQRSQVPLQIAANQIGLLLEAR